jgi:cytochrome P450
LPIAQFPILKLIPERWVPSRQFALKTQRNNTKVFAKARALVEERRARGDLRDSLADRFLQGAIKSDAPLTVSQVNNTLLGTLHQGASEATTTGTMTSILFLAKHPNVQNKAQAELDRICGTERLPRWSDYNDLPYINCIVKEGLRIRPV